MLLTASSTWGQVILLLFALGLPIQLALGGLVALGRRVPGVVALLLPIGVLALGVWGTNAGIEAGIAAVKDASDPAWVPWFALDDRARAAGPAALAGLLAGLLALPVAAGAAWRGLRAPGRRRRHAWTGPAALAAAGAVAWVWLLLGAAWSGLPLAFVGTGIVLTAFSALCVPASRGARRAPLVIAFGALLVASLGAAVAAVGWSALGVSAALGDFDDLFGAVGEILAVSRRTGTLVTGLAPAIAVVVIGAAPSLLARRWSDLGPEEGVDLLAIFLLFTITAGLGAWGLERRATLTRLGGDHGKTVLAAAWSYDVPHLAPIPARVLAADTRGPRWLILRDRGGSEVAPLVDPLDSVGHSIRLEDGLLLPPATTLEDFYLALADSPAGEISLVGCGAVSERLAADIRRDGLLATGRCGAFPLRLRVTTELVDPRVIILLREHEVDDDGEIVSVDALRHIADRDVVLRGQADATLADLVHALHALAQARRVYLGFGVDLDGEAIPIGVDPRLRIASTEVVEPPPP